MYGSTLLQRSFCSCHYLKSLTVDVYCRTSVLMTSNLNLLIVLATILHLNIVPIGQAITWNSNIIDNEKIHVKGPKYRGPEFIKYKYNFKLLVDPVEDCSRKWRSIPFQNVSKLWGYCYIYIPEIYRNTNSL